MQSMGNLKGPVIQSKTIASHATSFVVPQQDISTAVKVSSAT